MREGPVENGTSTFSSLNHYFHLTGATTSSAHRNRHRKDDVPLGWQRGAQRPSWDLLDVGLRNDAAPKSQQCPVEARKGMGMPVPRL